MSMNDIVSPYQLYARFGAIRKLMQPFELGLYNTADYIVVKEGDRYKAVDTETKQTYVSDDASEVINYAIGQLLDGGVIYISQGTYVLKSKTAIEGTSPTLYGAVVINSSNITLVGAGINKTILKLDDGLGGNVIGVGANSSYTVISNLTIDGNKDNQTDTGIDGDLCGLFIKSGHNHDIIYNVMVINSTREGFYLHGGWCTYMNLYAKNCGQNGIEIDANADCNIINLYSINAGLHGIEIYGGSTPRETYNNICNLKVYGAQGYGIRIIKLKNGNIYGVNVNNCGLNGTEVHGVSVEYCDNVTLGFLNVLDCQGCGIRVYNSNRIDVMNAKLVRNSKSGAGSYYALELNNSQYCKILANTVMDDQATPTQTLGVGETGTSDYNIIKNNVILNTTTPLTIIGVNTITGDNIT